MSGPIPQYVIVYGSLERPTVYSTVDPDEDEMTVALYMARQRRGDSVRLAGAEAVRAQLERSR